MLLSYFLILLQVYDVFNIAISTSKSENITFATTSILNDFFAIKSSILYVTITKFQQNEPILNDVVEKLMIESKFIIQLDTGRCTEHGHFERYKKEQCCDVCEKL